MRLIQKNKILSSLLLLAASTANAAELQGRLQWAGKTVLSIPVSGLVTAVNVDSGDKVQKGSVLMKLDPRPFQTAMMRARAAVSAARADVIEAAKELKRATELFERTVLSSHELELVKIAHKKAQARMATAQAMLNKANLTYEYSVLRASRDIRIVSRHVSPGQTVISRCNARPLFTVADAGRMQVSAQISSSQLGSVGNGSKVGISVGDKKYQGTVRRIVRNSKEDNWRIDVVFSTGKGEKLWPGQSAVISLP